MKKMLSLTLGIALLAAAGTAYAATTDTNATGQPSTAPSASAKPFEKGLGKGFSTFNNTELQSLLGLDAAGLAQELAAGKSLAAIAEAKGVGKQQVIDLLVKQESARLDQSVTDGKITQDYADKQKSALAERIGAMVEKPGFGGKPGMDRERGGKGGFGKRGGHEGHGVMDQSFGDAADALGMTRQEVMEQIHSGKSLSEIAEDKGITKDQLVDTLTGKLKERVKTWVDRKHQAPSTTAPAAPAAPGAAATN